MRYPTPSLSVLPYYDPDRMATTRYLRIDKNNNTWWRDLRTSGVDSVDDTSHTRQCMHSSENSSLCLTVFPSAKSSTRIWFLKIFRVVEFDQGLNKDQKRKTLDQRWDNEKKGQPWIGLRPIKGRHLAKRWLKVICFKYCTEISSPTVWNRHFPVSHS